MNKHIIWHDFKRNKAINIGLLLFIIFSATLTVISTMVAVQTFTAISKLYEVAQPPHFLQMHKGEIDINEIETFMEQDPRVEDWQIVTMIDVLGDQWMLHQGENSTVLSDFRLDIGLVKQNSKKDLLLNDQHQKVIIEDGYIGILALMMTMYDIKVGDTITLTVDQFSKTFIISDIILDAQMNSPLTSSTRILLSDGDFDLVADEVNNFEYLIEAYFFDRSVANSFQTDYQNAGLAQDGQAVTYTLIFILSAFTDIVTVFVMLIVSALLVFMSFVCVRFTMLAAIEEEIQEIGTMKAIGLSHKDIRQIYLGKYRFLAMLGSIIGYFLALVLVPLFTSHITTTFGDLPLSPIAIVLSIITAFLIIIIINRYAKHVLRKLKKLTVIDTLIKGQGMGDVKRISKKGLYQAKKLKINPLLSIREVTYYFKSWAVVLFLTLATTMMIIIPVNILATFKSDDFITYMGSSKEDILIELNPGDNLVDRYQHVISILDSSDDVSIYYSFKTIRMQTLDQDGKLFNLSVDSGNHAGVGLKYLEGNAPKNIQEIALSFLNADSLGKKVGDYLLVYVNDTEESFYISGIYQDVTSGGFTAKMIKTYPNLDGQSYSIAVDLKDDSHINQIADSWKSLMGQGIKVYPMDEFINQTLGGVSSQLQNMVLAIIVISLGLTVLALILFLKLRLVKDFAEISILKAIGFSNKDIHIQYLIKVGMIVITGVMVGILLSLILGNPIVNLGLGFASLGVKEIALKANLWMIFLTPIMMILVSLGVTKLGLNQINHYRIMSLINE